jgi:N-formylglutamate amidohydrolase
MKGLAIIVSDTGDQNNQNRAVVDTITDHPAYTASYQHGFKNTMQDYDSPPEVPYILRRSKGTQTPFVFAAPHSGRHYPQSLRDQTALSPSLLRASEDAWVDKLFEHVPQFGGTQLIAPYGRSYVDLNRAANELDPKMFSPQLDADSVKETHRVRAGLGVIPELVAPGQKIYSAPLPAREAEKRINDVYHGYHDKLRRLVSERKASFGYAILVDCHSMPSGDPAQTEEPTEQTEKSSKKGKAARIIDGLKKRKSRSQGADIVLGDIWGSSCDSMLTALVEKLLIAEGFKVIRNIPYAGGFATQHYGKPQKGIHALQIEINRSLYMNEVTLEPLASFKDIQRKLSRFSANLITEYSRTVSLAAE